jgi:hypothetical protein
MADAPLNPLFIAVGHNGLRLASADGSEWKNQQLGKEGETYRAVAFGNKRFVAVGSYGGSNIFAASTDGATWKAGTRDAKYVAYFRGLAFGGDTFVGLGGDPGSVGDSKPFICTSSDGLTWSDALPVPGKHILRRAAYGDGRFAAVGDRGRRAATKDTKTWTEAEGVKAIDTLVDIAFGIPAGPVKKPVFVGVGLHGLRMTSADGVKWENRQAGEEGEHLNSIIWAGDRFVAIGMGATYLSSNGVNWKREKNSDAPTTAAYGRGVFVGANWKGRLMRSTDGIEWKQVHKSEQHVESIAFGEL